MEGINNINGIQGVTPSMNHQIRPNQPQQAQGGKIMHPPFIAEISQIGQLFNAVEETGEFAISELKLFNKSLFEAMQNDTFDVETLVENASDTIKDIAEESGIDLTAALSEFQENAPRINGTFPQGPPLNGGDHQGPPPPPPTEGEYSTIIGDEDSSYLEDILTDDTNF